MTIDTLEQQLSTLSRRPADNLDEALGLAACEEALEAARFGNYGVGAVLVDPDGKVLARGRNRSFFPRFRSDLHAEMEVMNAFEDRGPPGDMRGYLLVTSLGPCPMCLARLLIAGVETVKFLAQCGDPGRQSAIGVTKSSGLTTSSEHSSESKIRSAVFPIRMPGSPPREMEPITSSSGCSRSSDS